MSQLRGMLKWGDVVLFKCANPVSKAQRLATGAEWDHVALVVKNRASRTLELLESTGDGVACYPLESRLRAYGTEFTKCLAVRSLMHTRTFREFEGMCNFVGGVVGMPYGFNLRKLVGAMGINERPGMGRGKGGDAEQEEDEEEEEEETTTSFTGSQGGRSTDDSGVSKDKDKNKPPRPQGVASMGGVAGVGTLLDFSNKSKSYFCSELIAACLKEMGIMLERRNALYFWPGEFGEGGAVDKSMVEGRSYGPEIIVDCKVPEIGAARVTRGDSDA